MHWIRQVQVHVHGSMKILRNNVPNGVDQWRFTGIICKMAWYESMEILRNNVPNGVDQWRFTEIICKMVWYGSMEIHRNNMQNGMIWINGNTQE